MKIAVRFASTCLLASFVFCAPRGVSAQEAATRGATAGYATKRPINITTVQPFSPDTVLVLTDDSGASASSSGGRNAASLNAGNAFGLQTVPLFAGAFTAAGGPDIGKSFSFIMMGNDPLAGGKTTIPVRVTEVSLQLLNADGSTLLTWPYAPFEDIVSNSPNFESTSYTSSNDPTQFADAVQRAEFFNMMKQNWHTLLGNPAVVNRITWQIPRFVNVKFPDGTVHSVRSYFRFINTDGSTAGVVLLRPLFNFLYTNALFADINANNFTTDSINFDAFPNTFLFSLNLQNPNTPGSCCVIGFHTFAYDPSVTPEPVWIAIYASYMSPGIFGGGFEDVTAFSHEISEAFNDPFGSNAVPAWQFPIPNLPPTAKVCQGNLETGDPVEVLPTGTVPLNIKETGQVFTYHPQTEALLQWFEMGPASNAINGAFSYPDTSALTHSAKPCPQ